MAEAAEIESRPGDEGSAARRVARVYAEALLDVADERGQADEVGRELSGIVTDVFGIAPGIEAALASPVVKRTAKAPIIGQAFQGKVSDLTFNFLNVLNAKDRLTLIRHAAAAYRDLLDQRSKRVRVTVRSAVPLTDAQTEHLRQAVGHATGLEPVVTAKIDPTVLGGMIVQVGDQVFDSSVRTRIETIRNHLLARSSNEIQAGRDRFSTAG
jgi:F-type H+-transporting ATPase subunit delta